jgi:hypothetical protein
VTDHSDLTPEILAELERIKAMTPDERRRAYSLGKLAEIEREADVYAEYIVSPAWRARADAAKKRVGYRCLVCNSSHDLNAHHRTYERLGHELEIDIIVLCRDCHELFHTNRRLQK